MNLKHLIIPKPRKLQRTASIMSKDLGANLNKLPLIKDGYISIRILTTKRKKKNINCDGLKHIKYV